MYTPPNELYTAFSFIGFVLCAVPLYWHLESALRMCSRDLEYLILVMYDTAWNMGTCLYMIWTGLGCLLQCINSIVWNKNTINRAPVYCDICKPPHVLSLDIHSPSINPQQPVFKSHSMLQSLPVHFASTVASTRPLRRQLRGPHLPTSAGPSYMICSLVLAFRSSR